METLDNIRVIGFDADDTLWVNETHFREAEAAFAKLLEAYEVSERVHQELFKVEMRNLSMYGYGVKSFVLSMLECALELSHHTLPQAAISEIIRLGKDMMERSIELLPHVTEVLAQLQGHFRLIVITKGDLLDQERKLQRSRIAHYFHHVEILHEKEEANYEKLLQQQGVKPQEFMMVGNSLKSDILPVLSLGARAIHIPYHTTWQHEEASPQQVEGLSYLTLPTIAELPKVLF